jgi:hypothetical protein
MSAVAAIATSLCSAGRKVVPGKVVPGPSADRLAVGCPRGTVEKEGDHGSAGLSRGSHLDRFDYRRIVILRLVDAGRDRPHPHGLGRKRPHQVADIVDGWATSPIRWDSGLMTHLRDKDYAGIDHFGHFAGLTASLPSFPLMENFRSDAPAALSHLPEREDFTTLHSRLDRFYIGHLARDR